MRRWFMMILAAVWLPLAAGTACHGGGAPEIMHERIAVTLEPAAHLLTGECTVTLNPHGATRLPFALHPGATVLHVTVDGQEVPVAFTGGTLTVGFYPGGRERTVRVGIGYRASFNDPLPGRTATTEDPSYGVNGVIAEEGVFLGGGADWYPEAPGVPARRTVEVTAPAGIEAVTAGRRLERGTRGDRSFSVWEEEHPVTSLSLSAGRYVVTERKRGALPLYAYFSPANASLAESYLDASARYITFYEGLFGPYPFEKFAIVENFIPTGYGFPSYTLLGGAVIRLPFIIGTSLPHEIAHNWWGNGVLADYRQGNWSEGIVTYVADYLLEERKSPAAGRDYRFRLLTEYASLVAPATDFPLKEFESRTDPSSRAIGYGKGAMLFHMLRTMIGDEAFFGALRDVCRERMYAAASWNDFTRAFSRRTGKDLAPFVDQWLARTGGPHLSLKDVTSKRDGGKWRVAGTIVQTAPLWQFPVTLGVTAAGKGVRQTVAVSEGRTPFSITVPDRPSRLVLDPDADLFRILARGEIPPSVNTIKGSRGLVAVIADSCTARPETVKLLLESLGQGGATVLRENEVRGPELAGHDLFVCGVPSRKGVLPVIGGEVTVSPQEFVVSGEAYRSVGDALLLVGGHPADRDRVAALFLPLSAAAAEACVTKITHYGKYGFLVFSGGQNRRKGVLPAGGGGTEINF